MVPRKLAACLAILIWIGACNIVRPYDHIESGLSVSGVNAWKRAWQAKAGKGRLPSAASQERIAAEVVASLSTMSTPASMPRSGERLDSHVARYEAGWLLVDALKTLGVDGNTGNQASAIQECVRALSAHAERATATLERSAANGLTEHGYFEARHYIRLALRANNGLSRRAVYERLHDRDEAITTEGELFWRTEFEAAMEAGVYGRAMECISKAERLDQNTAIASRRTEIQRLATDQEGLQLLARARSQFRAERYEEASSIASVAESKLIDPSEARELISSCNDAIARVSVAEASAALKDGRHRLAHSMAQKALSYAYSGEAVALRDQARLDGTKRIVLFPIRNRCIELETIKMQHQFGPLIRQQVAGGLDGWHSVVPDRHLDSLATQVSFQDDVSVEELINRLKQTSLRADYALHIEIVNFTRNDIRDQQSDHSAAIYRRSRTETIQVPGQELRPQFWPNGAPIYDNWGQAVHAWEPALIAEDVEVFDYRKVEYTLHTDEGREWIEANVALYAIGADEIDQVAYRTEKFYKSHKDRYISSTTPLDQLFEVPADGKLVGRRTELPKLHLTASKMKDHRRKIAKFRIVDDELAAWLQRQCQELCGLMNERDE